MKPIELILKPRTPEQEISAQYNIAANDLFVRGLRFLYLKELKSAVICFSGAAQTRAMSAAYASGLKIKPKTE